MSKTILYKVLSCGKSAILSKHLKLNTKTTYNKNVKLKLKEIKLISQRHNMLVTLTVEN